MERNEHTCCVSKFAAASFLSVSFLEDSKSFSRAWSFYNEMEISFDDADNSTTKRTARESGQPKKIAFLTLSRCSSSFRNPFSRSSSSSLSLLKKIQEIINYLSLNRS